MDHTATPEAKTTPTEREGDDEQDARDIEAMKKEQLDYIRRVVAGNNISVDAFYQFVDHYEAEERQLREEREERVAKSTGDIKRLTKLWQHASKTGLSQEVIQQFTDEFAKPLGNYAWKIQAQQWQSIRESKSKLPPVETQVQLYKLLCSVKEGVAKIASNWNSRIEIRRLEASLRKKIAVVRKHEALNLKLRMDFKEAAARAVGNEDMMRKIEDMKREVEAMPTSYAAEVAEVERALLELRKTLTPESQPTPKMQQP
ncbi:hypothetical protein GGI24_000811 [Coemansia furcata]|nr:hypothetical protein GGI24_000811 [Coemansia furcata]